MQNEYLISWIKEASSIPSKVQLLFEGITEESLNKKPAPGKWSIGELMAHIIVSNEQYFPTFKNIISGQHKNPFLGKFKAISSFFGESILKSVEPETEKEYKTVKKFQPGKQRYPLQIANEFEDHQKKLIEYAKASDRVDHAKTIVASPAAPIIIYSLENAFKIILSHELRHINQAMSLKVEKKKTA